MCSSFLVSKWKIQSIPNNSVCGSQLNQTFKCLNQEKCNLISHIFTSPENFQKQPKTATFYRTLKKCGWSLFFYLIMISSSLVLHLAPQACKVPFHLACSLPTTRSNKFSTSLNTTTQHMVRTECYLNKLGHSDYTSTFHHFSPRTFLKHTNTIICETKQAWKNVWIPS